MSESSASQAAAAAAAATRTVDVTEFVFDWLSNKVETVMPEKHRVFVSGGQKFGRFTYEVCEAFLEALELEGPASEALFDATMNHYRGQHQQSQGSTVADLIRTQQREREFAQPYIGDDVPAQLESYIDKCWAHCCEYYHGDMYPYTTIVQSSGFGKSRLLRELALRTKTAAHMKVLYVCVRQGRSPGYPVQTAKWPGRLFPFTNVGSYAEKELSSLLQTVFHNAMRDWDSVGEDCLAHFADPRQGNATYATLTRAVPDASANRTDQCERFAQRRILVLALDEARWLLKTSLLDKSGSFGRLRRALILANNALKRKYGRCAGIFAVLADTDSHISSDKISSFVAPPPPLDPSSRVATRDKDVVFPPFVLTQTMDVFLDADMKQKYQAGAVSSSSEFYREFVQKGTEEMRSGLADMGRPLWQQYKIAKGESCSLEKEWEDLLALAAETLVGGQSPSLVAEGGDSSGLCGVAALLCRVGIRPYSWLPLASRVVADNMAVLSHVNLNHDQFVSSYSSEPVLTFGAARVWYESATVNSADNVERSSRHLLEHLILPELATMLHQAALDTGGMGALVARIVLLLAMDATGVVESNIEAQRCYAGEFYSVATFLRTLSGDSTEVLHEGSEADAPRVDDLLAPWEAWKVGFSHFVQLSTEPSEEVLWAMLARRAACALPRDFGSVDLLIPIFQDSEVSMVLIQVETCEGADPDYPASAVQRTRPDRVFQGDLKKTANECVVRVCMSLAAPRRCSSVLLWILAIDGVRC